MVIEYCNVKYPHVKKLNTEERGKKRDRESEREVVREVKHYETGSTIFCLTAYTVHDQRFWKNP